MVEEKYVEVDIIRKEEVWWVESDFEGNNVERQMEEIGIDDALENMNDAGSPLLAIIHRGVVMNEKRIPDESQTRYYDFGIGEFISSDDAALLILENTLRPCFEQV